MQRLWLVECRNTGGSGWWIHSHNWTKALAEQEKAVLTGTTRVRLWIPAALSGQGGLTARQKAVIEKLRLDNSTWCDKPTCYLQDRMRKGVARVLAAFPEKKKARKA